MPHPAKRRAKRGRPPRTSKQQIVDTAIRLLTEQPETSLSLQQLAHEIGITPMAIYRHVRDKDELLQLTTQKLLEGLKPEIPYDEPWQTQLEIWAHATRHHFLRYPALLRIIGWRNNISRAWLHHFAVLVRILRQAQLEDPALAEAALWTSKVTMGMIEMEIMARVPETDWTLTQLDPHALEDIESDELKRVWPHLLRQPFRKQFDDSIRHMIRAVEQLAATNTPKPRRPKRKPPTRKRTKKTH